MRNTDLTAILYYGDNPVRVGRVKDEIVFCLADLLDALGVSGKNVTNITRRLPGELYYRGSYIGFDGVPINGHVIIITLDGACVTLPRVYKVDLMNVVKLLKWMRNLDATKLKGA